MWPAEEPDYEDDAPAVEPPTLTVYPNDVEPLILYGPGGSVLVSWTPAIGFARVLEQ